MGKRRPALERVMAKVDVRGPDECWPWTGAVGSDGYGHVRIGGKHGRIVAVHRVVLGIENEPPEVHGRHDCDFPLCCNRSHLQVGTMAQNMDDKRRRGRARVPKPNNGPKLTATGRQEIRDRYARRENLSAISRAVGVTPTRVRQVLQEVGDYGKAV